MVGGDVVAAVHQVVGHDVDHIDGLEDLGALLLCECDHVDLAAWHGDGEGFVAELLAQGREELWVCLDLGCFVLVRDLFVVLSVAAGVLPVDIFVSC